MWFSFIVNLSQKVNSGKNKLDEFAGTKTRRLNKGKI